MTGDFGCVWIERKRHCTKRGPDRILGNPSLLQHRSQMNNVRCRTPKGSSEAQIQSRRLDPGAVVGTFLLCPPGSSWYRGGVGGFLLPQGLASVLGKTGEVSVLQLRASSCFSVHAQSSALSPLHQLARKSLVLGRALVGKYLRLGRSCRGNWPWSRALQRGQQPLWQRPCFGPTWSQSHTSKLQGLYGCVSFKSGEENFKCT